MSYVKPVRSWKINESFREVLLQRGGMSKLSSEAPIEIGRMGLSGWPCCACDEIITGDDVNAVAVMLEKQAGWKYPTWGNALRGIDGLALATLCGHCASEKRQPIYAVKKVDDDEAGGFERVPLTELKDIVSPRKEVPPEIDSIKYEGGDQWPPPEPLEEKTPDDVTPEDVPDINAVSRLCFHFWKMSPEDVLLKLNKNRDLITDMSPWEAWLTIKIIKQSK